MDTANYIDSISKEYARYVLVSRAIPMITDGQKTSQRIALYMMQDVNRSIKTLALIGKCVGSGLYHHGDAAMGNAISYLAGPYINNHPLLHGEGAFGSLVDPVAFGAPRYTEVRRSEFAEQELYIDEGICPQIDSYDGAKTMPLTFMPRLPLVLLNGIRGIAVGFACNILPRSLEELREAVSDVLSNGTTNRPLMPFYEQYDCDIIRDHSNASKYHIRGKLSIINTTTVKITSIPPAMNIETAVKRLIALEADNQIVSFVDSTSNKIDITIKMTRASLSEHTEDSLITMFRINMAETENLTVLDATGTRVIKYNSPQELIKDFVEWRLSMYKNRYVALLETERAVELFLRCFIACFNGTGDGKRSIAVSISSIKSRKDMVVQVENAIAFNKLELDADIVNRIVALPVHRFTKDGLDTAKANLRDTLKLINTYTGIMNSPTKQKNIYKAEIMKSMPT